MTVLMSLALSRLEMADWDRLPDGTKPCASSLLITRLISGMVRFSKPELIPAISRFEVVPLMGTKPCCSSKLMTRGMLGVDRFSIKESRLRESRFEFVVFAVVAFALGTKPACLRLTMYESIIALIEELLELVWRLSSKDSKTKGLFPRAISDAKPAAWSAGRLDMRDAMASDEIC